MFSTKEEMRLKTVDRQFVGDLLQADATYRRDKEWPLIPFEEFSKLRATNFRVNRQELLMCGTARSYDNLKMTHTPTYGPEVKNILQMCPNLVLAGGAVLHSLFFAGRYTPKDFDFFFWGITEEQAEEYITKICKHYKDEDDQLGEGWYEVYRNENVTTMIWDGHIFQFIHRVYPNKSSIIGGFDLGPCMTLYDGECVYATPLGAFSLVSGLLIVDVSRRSKSFSARIIKYCYKGFNAVLLCKTERYIQAAIKNLPFQHPKVLIGEQFGVRSKGYFGHIPNSLPLSVVKSLYASCWGDQNDYEGGGEFNAMNIEKANTMLAIKGEASHLAAICWGGSFETAFEEPEFRMWPDLKRLIDRNHPQRGCQDYLDHSKGNDKRTKFLRWFGYEAMQKLYRNHVGHPELRSYVQEAEKKLRDTKKVLASRENKPRWIGMNDNPGQQFTSSLYPIADGLSWYSPKHRNPLWIGIPTEVCVALWHSYKTNDGAFGVLPRDIFRLVMRKLRRCYEENSVRNVMSIFGSESITC